MQRGHSHLPHVKDVFPFKHDTRVNYCCIIQYAVITVTINILTVIESGSGHVGLTE